jgi:hypothetical protein
LGKVSFIKQHHITSSHNNNIQTKPKTKTTPNTKMHSTTFITLAMAITSALALPAAAAAAADVQLSKRAEPLIDLWQDRDFLGLKFTGSANVGDCKNLPRDFNNNVSSGKARPGFRCTVWVDRDCQGTGFSFNAAPGSSAFPEWIDNKSSSWKCVK